MTSTQITMINACYDNLQEIPQKSHDFIHMLKDRVDENKAYFTLSPKRSLHLRSLYNDHLVAQGLAKGLP